MKHSFRSAAKAMLAVAALFYITIAIAIITFIWWMFAHGFHEIGQFLLELKSA